jgi:hypothetical protein
MQYITEAIHILHNSQARHRRKGFKYGSVTTSEMLKHAAEELVELVEASALVFNGEGKNPFTELVHEELADLIMILMHLAYVNGFTSATLQVSMLDKLQERFKLKKHERAAIRAIQAKLINKANKKVLFGSEEA